MMLAGTGKVTGGILWANLHLLFWRLPAGEVPKSQPENTWQEGWI